MFRKAITDGPDGYPGGWHGIDEPPQFVHYACSFFLAGTLGYLEGQDGVRSWNQPSEDYDDDFDAYAASHRQGGPDNRLFSELGITRASLDALAELRNALVHQDGNLVNDRNPDRPRIVRDANLPGVVVNDDDTVTLEAEFLEYVRLSAVVVRMYHGEG